MPFTKLQNLHGYNFNTGVNLVYFNTQKQSMWLGQVSKNLICLLLLLKYKKINLDGQNCGFAKLRQLMRLVYQQGLPLYYFSKYNWPCYFKKQKFDRYFWSNGLNTLNSSIAVDNSSPKSIASRDATTTSSPRPPSRRSTTTRASAGKTMPL